MTLPAFAERAPCCGAVAAERTRSSYARRRTGSRRSISPARRVLSSKLAAAVDRRDRRTDEQKDARPFHRPCSTYYAGSDKMFSIEDKGRSDADFTLLTLTLTLTLTFNSRTGYGHDPYTCKNEGQRSVCSKKLQTNGRTRPIAIHSI